MARSGIARFNADGTLDLTFNPGSGAASSSSTPAVYLAARQQEGANAGKLILEGDFDSYDGHPADGFVRINQDGSFSDVFVSHGLREPSDTITEMLIQDDDRVVICGTFNYLDDVAFSNIARLNADGGVDTTFVTENFFDYAVSARIAAVI